MTFILHTCILISSKIRFMKLSTLFRELESSLFPTNNRLRTAIDGRIDLFLQNRLGLSHYQIAQLRASLSHNCGTILKGLQENFTVNQWDYLRFIYDLHISDYLHPDPGLRETLLNLPYRCWILSNADNDYIQRVLSTLKIDDCFAGIIDYWSLFPYYVPQKEAYQRALDIAAIHNPRECVFMDNAPKNIIAAREGGFNTVLVSSNGVQPLADLTIKDIHHLKQALP